MRLLLFMRLLQLFRVQWLATLLSRVAVKLHCCAIRLVLRRKRFGRFSRIALARRLLLLHLCRLAAAALRIDCLGLLRDARTLCVLAIAVDVGLCGRRQRRRDGLSLQRRCVR